MDYLIHRSLNEKIKLEMIYMKKDGTATQRVVRVLVNADDHILAYCFTKREVRRFNKTNILAVLPVKRKKQMGA